MEYKLFVEDSSRDFKEIVKLEVELGIILPKIFKETIEKYNDLLINYDYIEIEENEGRFNTNMIFKSGRAVAEFDGMIEFFYSTNYHKENWSEYMISKSLIFFGSDGAGRYFCFDYALEKDGKVPVVIVMPDADAEERGRYIADDFEQFLEMLGNPEMEAPYYAIEYPYIENGEL